MLKKSLSSALVALAAASCNSQETAHEEKYVFRRRYSVV